MAEEVITSKGKYGLWTALIGGIIILIDGIVVLATKKLYGWSATGYVGTGWAEIILSIIILAIIWFYKRSPKGIGWSTVALAIITMPFDGGFWEIGAIIALIGGALIAYEK